jgi:exodeoxyribonuclease V alpha subunit
MGLVDDFFEAGVLNNLEVAFARMLERCTNCEDDIALLMSALACRAPRVGDICIDVENIDRTVMPETDRNLAWPPVEERVRAVKSAPFISANDDGKELPLRLEDNRLYLYRYYKDEVHLAQRVLEMASQPSPCIASKLDSADADNLNIENACAVLSSSSLAIITGGPGTGKTTLASKLIAQFIKNGVDPQEIWAVAPTGRASARLGETLGMELRSKYGSVNLGDANIKVATIHSAFGIHPDSPFKARFNEENEAPVRVLAMDEASMVDLVTMTRVFEALPKDCVVLLLGDPYQLASVEAGSVLRDLCNAMSLRSVRVTLGKVHRFQEDIGQLADRVHNIDKDENFAGVVSLLRQGGNDSVHYDDCSSSDWLDRVVDMAVQNYKEVIGHALDGNISKATLVPSKFRLLSALRKGKYGCEALNAMIKEKVFAGRQEWFPGRVIMVVANDPVKGLFNGDVGVAVRIDGKIKVAFPSYGSSDRQRLFDPSFLPDFEDAFATTIHKAQGSEADEVMLVFPPEDSPILSREILYTGITRAKKRLWLFARQDVLFQCLQRTTRRASGLAKKLDMPCV